MDEIFATLTKTCDKQVYRSGNKKKLNAKLDTITDHLTPQYNETN